MAQSGKITEIVDVKAFEQIVRLQDELSKTSALMQSLSATTIQLANNTKNTTPKEAVESTKKLAKTTDLLVETQKKEVQQQNELIKSEAALNAATKQYAGSQLELKNKIALLTKEYERQSQATEEGRKKAIALKQEINRLDAAYKANATAAQQQAKNIGNYKSALDGAKGAIMPLIGGIASMGAVMKVTQMVIASTDALTDAWERTLSGAKESVGVLTRAIANMDFTNLTQNLTDAIKAGRVYAEVMDDVSNITRGLTIEEKNYQIAMAKQRLIFKNAKEDSDERKKAGQEMKRLTKEFTDAQVANTKRELDGILNLAVTRSKLTKQEIEDYITAKRANFEKIKEGEGIMAQYEAMKTSAIGTGNALADLALNTALGTTANKDAAESYIKNLTPAQKAAYDAARKYSNINDDLRDKIAAVIVKEKEHTLAALETQVSMLKTENSIEKAAAKTEKLSEKTKRYTGTVEGIPMIQKKATDALTDFMVQAGFTAEEIIDLQDKITKATEKNLDEQFEKRNEYSKNFWNLLDEDKKKVDESLAKQKEVYQAVYGQIQDTITGFFNAAFENRQSKIDEELDQLEANKERELQIAGDNAAKKEEIERKYQSEKERIDKKAKKVEYDKAVFNRLTASANIAYSTAEAVMKAVAAFPLTGGLPWTAIIAALGSLQVASVWAAPLPKFAKGTQNAPEGFAIVGERGSEMVIDNGKAWMTPDTDTLTYLSKGAKVIPHDEVMQMAEAMGNPAIPKMTDKGLGYDITGIMTDVKHGIINAIKNKQETHINITEAGMRKITRSANGWTEYINKNIRH